MYPSISKPKLILIGLAWTIFVTVGLAKISVDQIKPWPVQTFTTPQSIREEPFPQSGSTFVILNHKVGWDLQIYVSRSGGPSGLLRPFVDYTSLQNGSTVTVTLKVPLSTNDKIQWVKWQ